MDGKYKRLSEITVANGRRLEVGIKDIKNQKIPKEMKRDFLKENIPRLKTAIITQKAIKVLISKKCFECGNIFRRYQMIYYEEMLLCRKCYKKYTE